MRCLPTKLGRDQHTLIELTGLDRQPANDVSAKDRRWINRRETWYVAIDSKTNLGLCDTDQMRKQIVKTCIAAGYWSVWMTVFRDDADMLRRFIDEFTGTCVACFDANNQYQPIARSD